MAWTEAVDGQCHRERVEHADFYVGTGLDGLSVSRPLDADRKVATCDVAVDSSAHAFVQVLVKGESLDQRRHCIVQRVLQSKEGKSLFGRLKNRSS
ncbi:hypothetical protein MTO96_028798 [Rhipicephalus appendiculatus]